MPIYPWLSNFTSGEFSPRLNARVDISKYYNACKTLFNMFVHPHGGASRRFGLHYVAETKYSAYESRLIPFVYSVDQSYVMEFGNQYIRFFANSGVVTSGVSAYEIATSYTTSVLWDLKYAQKIDTMRIVCPTIQPRQLSRLGPINWTIGNISFTSTPPTWTGTNYPRSVAFYEQRAAYAGTAASPQGLWISKTGMYDDLTVSSTDDGAMALELDDGQNNTIQWLAASRYLNVGTSEGEWVINSGTDGQALTPSRKFAKKVTNYGSNTVQAKFVGNAILFISRLGRKVRELVYTYVEDTYDADDKTLLAEHITAGGIVDWAFQKEPDAILWCVRADGKLLGLTYNAKQEVVAWHLHETDGFFESVCVIPTESGDQVWFIIQRTIGGSTKRYVEYMEDDFGTDLKSAWFVDSGLDYSGTAVTTVTGLDHLEGKLVSILADGAPAPNTTVVSGKVTIPSAFYPSGAASITVGLPYRSYLEPMDLEIGNNSGTSQGRLKKIHNVCVRFYRTLGANIISGSNTETIQFRKASDPMGSAPPLFTGDKIANFPGGWSRNATLIIEQKQPLPMTVLGIGPMVNVE